MDGAKVQDLSLAIDSDLKQIGTMCRRTWWLYL